jgi:serine-type D-Ala-D-Ala carboxypeptidase/endopeptidase (penicillin-binding protein 4)
MQSRGRSVRGSMRRRARLRYSLLWTLLPFLGLAHAPAASSAPHADLAAAARAILGANQGVYVQAADGSVLVAQQAAHAVHPASVSKVPTTLALLRQLGPSYRFITTFSAVGSVVGGRLEGDLLVQSHGDPALVDEDALLVAERLNALGLRRVTGSLRVRGPLLFDWQSDAEGLQLRAALSGRAPQAAWTAVRTLAAAPAEGGTPPRDAGTLPGLEFDQSTPEFGTGTEPERILLIHRSQPLLALAKALNDYSNNIFNALASSAGGAAQIERIARASVPPGMRTEIVLHDAAGADPANRLSPRAAVRLLRALDDELARDGHTLVDILPVAGIDAGTLHDRLDAPGEAGCVVGKTGTYGDYGASALIGALRTADRGTVYFAILDHGIPVPQARRRQDRFVRLLLQRLHPLPWNYQRDARPAIARVEIGAPST